MSALVEQKIRRIAETGRKLAAQVGGVFIIDERKVSDFRARAEQ